MISKKQFPLNLLKAIKQSFIISIWIRRCYFTALFHLDPEPDINTDELLGIATVDLSLLMTGFRCIHGWYNLLDFSGQKTGQIKVESKI